ncbi:MAG: curA [Myxococcales bacterium]|nr:curA [Myxococcales bacterium]
MENRQWRLRARPTGMVDASHFEKVAVALPSPGPGEVLVKTAFISLDPAMRGWMNDTRSYIPPVGLGEVMRAIGIGTVVASNDPAFVAGDLVTGPTNVQEYAVAPAKQWFKVAKDVAPPERWLGVLGMPGLTAYFGLLDVGQAKAGETLVVSAASGAVGAVVGQIGKTLGMRVVGIAGGAAKCKYIVDELGFDAAVDYKSEDVRAALKKHCEKGIDVYFDNVGGELLDVALAMLRKQARVVLCGAISQYNNEGGVVVGPKNYLSLLVNSARMEGFVVFQFAQRYTEGVMKLAGWYGEGKLKAKEDVVEGLEKFPDALQRLYRGENFGKLVLKVA